MLDTWNCSFPILLGQMRKWISIEIRTLLCIHSLAGHNHTAVGKPRFLCFTVPLRMGAKVASENYDSYGCTSGLAQGLTLSGNSWILSVSHAGDRLHCPIIFELKLANLWQCPVPRILLHYWPFLSGNGSSPHDEASRHFWLELWGLFLAYLHV